VKKIETAPMRATCLSFQRLTALTLVLFAVLCQPAPALAGWGETALSREGDYIVNCSWTQLAKNGSAIRPTDDAYGSLNDNRIAWNGPDWVRPGEDSEAMISLLAAIPTMQQAGVDTKSYVRLQDLYFDSWITGSHAGPVFLATGAEAGGVPSQLHYSHTGKWLKSDGASAATTGIVLAAMYKRYASGKAMAEKGLAIGGFRSGLFGPLLQPKDRSAAGQSMAVVGHVDTRHCVGRIRPRLCGKLGRFDRPARPG
jgi:hypothetical protein